MFILDLPLLLVRSVSSAVSSWVCTFVHPLNFIQHNSSNALRIHYIKHVSHFVNFIIVSSAAAAGNVDYDTPIAVAAIYSRQ